jgi:hypothetical protein
MLVITHIMWVRHKARWEHPALFLIKYYAPIVIALALKVVVMVSAVATLIASCATTVTATVLP